VRLAERPRLWRGTRAFRGWGMASPKSPCPAIDHYPTSWRVSQQTVGPCAATRWRFPGGRRGSTRLTATTTSPGAARPGECMRVD
jgi:hypothetical protein